MFEEKLKPCFTYNYKCQPCSVLYMYVANDVEN